MARGWATTSSETEKGRVRSRRQEVQFWPVILSWLEAPNGRPPLPVCSACATELTIWGIPPEEGPELPLTPESLEASETATPGTPCRQPVVGRARAHAREGMPSAEANRPPQQWGEDEWCVDIPLQPMIRGHKLTCGWQTSRRRRVRDQADRRTAAGQEGNKAPASGTRGTRSSGSGTGMGTVHVATKAEEEAARAVLLPCGYLVCPRCLGNRAVVTRSGADKRCPANPWCTDELKSRHKCGHIVSHLLPGPSDAGGLEGVPRPSQPSDEDLPRPCWKCRNLALVVRIGDYERELPFGAAIPAFTCPPETPVTVSYYQRRDANSAAALMMMASFGFGGMGSVLAAGMVGRPSRVVVLEGPYSEAAKWRVLRTGFLAPRRRAVARDKR